MTRISHSINIHLYSKTVFQLNISVKSKGWYELYSVAGTGKEYGCSLFMIMSRPNGQSTGS